VGNVKVGRVLDGKMVGVLGRNRWWKEDLEMIGERGKSLGLGLGRELWW
jgi:hypothetical protein